MMLSSVLIEWVSHTASWLTFLGFAIGLAECWRFVPLRGFLLVMAGGYSVLYGLDIVHGNNPLVLIVRRDAPLLVYWWAPVVRLMVARCIICAALYVLIYLTKTWVPPEPPPAA